MDRPDAFAYISTTSCLPGFPSNIVGDGIPCCTSAPSDDMVQYAKEVPKSISGSPRVHISQSRTALILFHVLHFLVLPSTGNNILSYSTFNNVQIVFVPKKINVILLYASITRKGPIVNRSLELAVITDCGNLRLLSIALGWILD